jgi:pentatricopeptide repeat protein
MLGPSFMTDTLIASVKQWDASCLGHANEGEDDAYRVFRKMLESGNPPDDWAQLRAKAVPLGFVPESVAAVT